MKVLVVDDDPLILEVVVFKLEQSGHEVLSTTDALEGLCIFREVIPDVAVLDVVMPDLSGIELCREVRRDPSTASTWVILLTSRSEEDDVADGFNAGADDYVAKPFSLRELSSRVEAVRTRETREE